MIAVGVVAGALAVALIAALAWNRVLARRLRAVRDDHDVAVATLEERLVRNNELEDQLASSLDAMDLGVVLVRGDRTVVFRNRAAEAFTTARHGDALVAAAVDDLLDAALDGAHSVRDVDLAGPPLVAYQIRSFPLATAREGEPIGAVVLVEDVTERRRVDQVRRDFVANISHELRTPVGAVGLLADTIVDETDPATVRRLAMRMTDEADRVARTIEDLSELSRIEFGDETTREDVAVTTMVEEAVARIRSAAEQNGITIDVGPRVAAVVVGDHRQLTSAVYNLLDNAVKYSPAGSTVTVTTVLDADGGVRVDVADHGVGIPSRDLDRVFERFYRVDRARSRDTGGTGLGLAIVRHVVANHGGDVTVRSREGEGSTFSLHLPSSVVVDTPSEPAPAQPAPTEPAPAAREVERR